MVEERQGSFFKGSEKPEGLTPCASIESSRQPSDPDGSRDFQLSAHVGSKQFESSVLRCTTHGTRSSPSHGEDHRQTASVRRDQLRAPGQKYISRREAAWHSEGEYAKTLTFWGNPAARIAAHAAPAGAFPGSPDSSDVSAEPTCVIESECSESTQDARVAESEYSDSTQDAEDATEAADYDTVQAIPGTTGRTPLYGHLLSGILALVGDIPAEKARLALVCREWRDALDAHTAWPFINATHRPLSSLSDYAGHIGRLLVGAETLSLAEGDTPQSIQLLIRLARAPPASKRTPVSSCVAFPTSFVNQSAARSFVQNCCAHRASERGVCRAKQSDNSAGSIADWRMPRLRSLRIHRSIGAGYVSYATPGALLAAMDGLRPTASTKLDEDSRDLGGLQYLEELVVECEVGAEVLLALRGKTPRLRSLVIAQLSAGETSSHEAAEAPAPAGVPAPSEDETECSQTPEERPTAFEALLLLLQSLPPQQLRVFGWNSSLMLKKPLSKGIIDERCRASGTTNSEESASLQAALKDLRQRLDQLKRTGVPEEAEGDELLSLLATQQNETLCALWAPLVEPSFDALQAFRKSCKRLTYCSIPGSSLVDFLGI